MVLFVYVDNTVVNNFDMVNNKIQKLVHSTFQMKDFGPTHLVSIIRLVALPI